MINPIFFRFSCLDELADCYGGEYVHPTCKSCGIGRREWTFDDLRLSFTVPHHSKRIRKWPLIGGMYHTVVQAQLAEALIAEGVTGFQLHLPKVITKQKGDYSHMPEIPECYILQPTGVIDFVIPETEYHPPCPECGYLKPKGFGVPENPFTFLEDTWDGSDIVRIRNHNCWQHIMFFNRKVIEVFRKNGWHHQIAYSANGKTFETISFGDATSPGIQVLNIDSDTWYEDTVEALKRKYPGFHSGQ